MRFKQPHWLTIIVLGYLVLGIVYTLSTPPLESSDEYSHYPVVQYIQTERALPILDVKDPGLWLQEGAQPPLYYALMALLTSWIDTTDLPTVHHLNPYVFVGNPNQVSNKNLIIHQPSQERFPGQGTVLAVYVIRLISVGLGVGTLLLTARLGTLLYSPRVGLFAAGLTAFNPMFLFVSAAVNNDSLAILLGHWGLYLLVRLWQDSPDPRTKPWLYARLGLVLGLGILTKLSLAGLLGLSLVALAWLSWRMHRRELLFIGGALTSAVALLISGWWFARNLTVYGDLTGLDAFIGVMGTRATPITLAGWIDEFGTFFRTYWGLFGGVNVAAPNFFYTFANALTVIGMIGFVKRIWRERERVRSGVWILVAWASILLLLLLQWNLVYTSFQGRLIFPALGALNVLWAIGLLAWVKEAWRSKVAVALTGAFLLAAGVLPWVSIRPAYAYPESLSAVPEAARFGPITFNDGAGAVQLIGVEMDPDQSVSPGAGPVVVALYWRASEPVSKDYVSSAHLLGREFQSVGQIDRYPGSGLIPTSRWEEGTIYRDEYHVYVKETAVAPAQLRVSVSLFDDDLREALPAIGPDGSHIPLLLVGEAVRLSAHPQTVKEPDYVLNVPFAAGITLAGYDLSPTQVISGSEVQLTLYWRAEETLDHDYTVFVHFVDAKGDQIAGADAPPVSNDYPTSLWQAGDRVDDMHSISVPGDIQPGEYQIRVGLYDPVTGVRLVRLDGTGDSAELAIVVGE